MKRLIVFIIISIFAVSCSKMGNERIMLESKPFGTYKISVITVDSCEYVYVKMGYGGGLSHKGNCKHCEEQEK